MPSHILARSYFYAVLLASAGGGCLQTSTPVDPEGADYPDFDPRVVDGSAALADGSFFFADGSVAPPAPGDAGVGSIGDATTPGPGTPDASAPKPPDAGMPRTDAGDPVVVSDADVPVDPPDSGVTGPAELNCTFTSRTDASGKLQYNGKYGCAVWVGSADKHVIKAFLVATRVANRTNLPTYRTAVSGVTVDVVTGATLNAPLNHSYTWSTVDANGDTLPDGNYTLNVETHSESGVDFVSVPFSKGAAPIDVTGGSDGDIKSTAVRCQ